MLMKQKKMLVLTFSQLKQIYTQEMPELVEMAAVSPTVEDFKAGLLKHLDSCGMVNEVAEEAREQIRLLLQYDGQDVHELSTGQDISVQTIRLLYQFLTEKLENIEMPTDLFLELFQLFKCLQGESVPLPSPQRIKSRNDRWDTGLDEEVREMRDENKERMLHLLIQFQLKLFYFLTFLNVVFSGFCRDKTFPDPMKQKNIQLIFSCLHKSAQC